MPRTASEANAELTKKLVEKTARDNLRIMSIEWDEKGVHGMVNVYAQLDSPQGRGYVEVGPVKVDSGIINRGNISCRDDDVLNGVVANWPEAWE